MWHKQSFRRWEERRLTRRQMLKAIGLSTGVVLTGGLTGCTSLLQSKRPSSVMGQLSAMKATKAFRRTREALGKSDMRTIHSNFRDHYRLLQDLASLAKGTRRGSTEKETQRLLRQLRELDLRIVDLFSRYNIWSAADEDWMEILSNGSEAFYWVDLQNRLSRERASTVIRRLSRSQ